jgi:hypothetical protein
MRYRISVHAAISTAMFVCFPDSHSHQLPKSKADIDTNTPTANPFLCHPPFSCSFSGTFPSPFPPVHITFLIQLIRHYNGMLHYLTMRRLPSYLLRHQQPSPLNLLYLCLKPPRYRLVPPSPSPPFLFSVHASNPLTNKKQLLILRNTPLSLWNHPTLLRRPARNNLCSLHAPGLRALHGLAPRTIHRIPRPLFRLHGRRQQQHRALRGRRHRNRLGY